LSKLKNQNLRELKKFKMNKIKELILNKKQNLYLVNELILKKRLIRKKFLKKKLLQTLNLTLTHIQDLLIINQTLKRLSKLLNRIKKNQANLIFCKNNFRNQLKKHKNCLERSVLKRQRKIIYLMTLKILTSKLKIKL